MNKRTDTAVIYGLTLTTDPNRMYFVPIMATDEDSRNLALNWAESLARISGQDVNIYRNGVKLITVPNKK